MGVWSPVSAIQILRSIFSVSTFFSTFPPDFGVNPLTFKRKQNGRKNFSLYYVAVYSNSLYMCSARLFLSPSTCRTWRHIDHFFHLGLGYSEILMFLFLLHGICLSICQLKRILRCRGLGRRANRNDPRQGCEAIEEELQGSGSTVGYRRIGTLR